MSQISLSDIPVGKVIHVCQQVIADPQGRIPILETAEGIINEDDPVEKYVLPPHTD